MDAETELSEAEINLNDKLVNVARSAQSVSEDAEPQGLTGKGNFLVRQESMEELRESLKEWKDATQAFLVAVGKVGG